VARGPKHHLKNSSYPVVSDRPITKGRFLLNAQHDAQFFSMYLFIFLFLYMFRTHRAHHQEGQIVSIQPLVAVTLCRWPCSLHVGSDLSTCTRHSHRQLPEVVLTQFVSPDDENDVLETCRVKNINKHRKNCASSWSFNKNHYKLHSQQNIEFYEG